MDSAYNIQVIKRVELENGTVARIPRAFSRLSLNRMVQILGHGKPKADVFFGTGDVFQFLPIVPTLLKISSGFAQIVEKAETLL
jgi:hypothetical protein